MKKIFITISLFFLAACGGGGGGGGGAAPTVSGGGGGGSGGGGTTWISGVTTAEANVYRTAEYNVQTGLEEIHAAEAYASLAKNGKSTFGSGVIVGVTDTGIQTNHPEFSGAIDPHTANSGWSFSSSEMGHGTHVSGIIAANKDGVGMQGVAPDATILGVFMLNGGSSPDGLYGIKYAADNGAKVVNASWGYANPDHSTFEVGIGTPTYNSYKAAFLADFTALKNDDALFVAATGNSAYTDYVGIPALYAQDPDFQGYIIAVGSVNSAGVISNFSNRCKEAKDYCMVAPGGDTDAGITVLTETITSTFPNSTYAGEAGTSMAAPQVSGAAAVIRGAWNFLTAPQVMRILFQTATDLGAPGVDDVYGNGLLNLYAAVQAQGQNLIVFGSSVSTTGYDAKNSSMMTSAIFGDAFTHNVAPQLANVVFFDDFGRDYKANLAGHINSYKPTHQTDLSYLMANNINSRVVPINFGEGAKATMKFNLSNFKNPDAPNMMGLKHLVMDPTRDPQLMNIQNSGFSFAQKDLLTKNSALGFAFNYDEISSRQQKDFGTSGFILKNNFGASPYQDFMRQGSGNFWYNSRKFNQLFVDQNFFDQKFALKFSYQNSYESPQLGLKGQKQNEMVDLGMMLRSKNDLSFLLSSGSLTEFNNNMLNSRSVGAFASAGDVKTTYVKLTAAKKFLEHFQLIASFSEGISKINGNQIGIFRSFNDVRSRSTSVALVHDNFMNGEIGLSYLEPLRVYRGSVNFDVPVARDFYGNVTRYQGSASLAPNGREQDFEIFYSRLLQDSASLRMNFLVQKEMANIKNFPTNYLGFVSYGKKF